MADVVRDRQQPQVQVVHTQHHRFDQGNTAGSNYINQSSGGPSTSQVLAVLTLLPVGGTLLALAGFTLAATVIGLLVATPVFIIFSPVLIPAILTVLLAVTGFLSSGALGLTGLSSFSYVFNRWGTLRGKQQQDNQDQFNKRRTLQDMAEYVGQKTKETGQKIESKAQQGQGHGQGQVHETIRT